MLPPTGGPARIPALLVSEPTDMRIDTRPCAAAALLLLTGCSGGGDGSPSAAPGTAASGGTAPATNVVRYAGTERALDAALLDVIGPSDGHYEVDVQLGDGTFLPGSYSSFGILYTYWYAVDDSVSFSVDLYSPGADGFRGGTFVHAPISLVRDDDGAGIRGRAVFTFGLFGYDFDGDGEVSEAEELEIVGGSVEVDAESAAGAVRFDVLLEDGTRASGAYSGPFQVVE